MGTNCHPPLSIQTAGGKQKMNFAAMTGIFRIIYYKNKTASFVTKAELYTISLQQPPLS